MSRLRLAALFLILVESYHFTFITKDWVVPSLLAVAAVAAQFFVREHRTGRRQRTLLLVVLCGCCGLLALLFPYAPPGASGLFRYPAFAHAVGLGALAFQVLQLYVKPVYDDQQVWWLRDAWGLRQAFPFYGIPVLIAAGDISGSSVAHGVFRVSTVMFVLALALYLATLRKEPASPASPSQRTSGRALSIVVLIALLLGSGASTTLLHYGDNVDTALNQLLTRTNLGQQVGFSTAGTLTSVTNLKTDNQRQTLRIKSVTVPAYMRGKVFSNFLGDHWQAPTERHLASLTTSAKFAADRADEGLSVYEIQARRDPNDAPEYLEVWPDPKLPRNILFHPLGSTHLRVPTENVLLDVHDSPSTSKRNAGAPYELLRAIPLPIAPREAFRDALLAVPDDLDPRIHSLATTIVGDAPSVEIAAARIAAYFHAHYDYRLGIQVPDGMRPITYFLLEKPAAHCEYFATGTVLLLRLAGFPARYVTGFVVHEHNPVGNYWVARGRDAHAWAEAYSPESGWFTVESTPPAGVPTGDGNTPVADWFDFLQHQWRETVVAFAAQGLFGGLTAALRFAGTLGGGGGRLLLLVVAIYLIYRIGKRLPRPTWSRRQRRIPDPRPELALLHSVLRQRDQILKKHGLQRSKDETLHAFADRVGQSEALPQREEQAAWYRSYADVRFRGTFTEEERAALGRGK